jgi:hypothetical protein
VAVYAIRVTGQVDAHWSEWFDGLMISNAQPEEALISGEIVDDAALRGTLNKIFNLNLALISVTRVGSCPQDRRCPVEPVTRTARSLGRLRPRPSPLVRRPVPGRSTTRASVAG